MNGDSKRGNFLRSPDKNANLTARLREGYVRKHKFGTAASFEPNFRLIVKQLAIKRLLVIKLPESLEIQPEISQAPSVAGVTHDSNDLLNLLQPKKKSSFCRGKPEHVSWQSGMNDLPRSALTPFRHSFPCAHRSEFNQDILTPLIMVTMKKPRREPFNFSKIHRTF